MDSVFPSFSGSLEDLASIDEELRGFLADLDAQPSAAGMRDGQPDDAQMAALFADILSGSNSVTASEPLLQDNLQTPASLDKKLEPTSSGSSSFQQQMLNAAATTRSQGVTIAFPSTAMTSSQPMTIAPTFAELSTQPPPTNFTRTITTSIAPSPMFPSFPNTSHQLASPPAPSPTFPPQPQHDWRSVATAQPTSPPAPSAATKADSGGRKRRASSRKDPHKAKQEQLMQQIQAMMSQLELLQSENEQLKMKHQVLEHVVQESNQHVKTLAEQSQQTTPPPPPPPAATTPPSSTLLQLLSMASSSPGSEPSTLESLPPETFALQWQQFLTSVAPLLLDCGGPSPKEQSVAAVRAMVQQLFSSISKKNIVLNSNILLQYHCRNLETQVVEDVGEPHWARAVASLELSPEQCKVIATAYDVYMGLMQKVLDENDRLKQQQAGGGAAAAAPAAAASLSDLHSASYAQHVGMLRCMLANFARHSSAVMWLASLVFGRLLTEVQFAKLCLHSWPYLPCGQSLMRLVAHKVQQQQQQQGVLSPQLSGAESGLSGGA